VTSPLTLKRAKDYDVLANGKVVGRIYEDAHLNADLPSPPKSRALGRYGQ
jgi:hypothetical protein